MLDWLSEQRTRNPRAYVKCILRIRRLAEMGHALRRPEADVLRDGIYELRAREGTVQYRILYFFRGQGVTILAHALTKEDEVPRADIERAIARRELFRRDPTAHTHLEDL